MTLYGPDGEFHEAKSIDDIACVHGPIRRRCMTCQADELKRLKDENDRLKRVVLALRAMPFAPYAERDGHARMTYWAEDVNKALQLLDPGWARSWPD